MAKKKECPFCGSKEYSSLRSGATRCCVNRETEGLERGSQEYQDALDRAIERYKVTAVRGKWYPREPISKIVDRYRRWMSKPEQWGKHFRLARGSSQYNALFPAATILLDQADWDVELALITVDEFFSELRKPCESFFWVVSRRNLPVYLSKARKKLAQRNTSANLQRSAVEASERGGDAVDDLYETLGTI